MTLGGVDMSKFQGEAIYAPLADPKDSHWFLDVKGIYVNGKTSSALQGGSLAAVFDTGTSNMLLPTNLTEVTDSYKLK